VGALHTEDQRRLLAAIGSAETTAHALLEPGPTRPAGREPYALGDTLADADGVHVVRTPGDRHQVVSWAAIAAHRDALDPEDLSRLANALNALAEHRDAGATVAGVEDLERWQVRATQLAGELRSSLGRCLPATAAPAPPPPPPRVGAPLRLSDRPGHRPGPTL